MGTNSVFAHNWDHILDSIYAIQNANIPKSPEIFQLQFISYEKLRREAKEKLELETGQKVVSDNNFLPKQRKTKQIKNKDN